MLSKPIESIAGTVRMADGTRRAAYRNTYKSVTFSADGSTPVSTEEVRIEFLLFTNAARGGSRKYRAATAKQADTFTTEAL